jgi:hypothetical protein
MLFSATGGGGTLADPAPSDFSVVEDAEAIAPYGVMQGRSAGHGKPTRRERAGLGLAAA